MKFEEKGMITTFPNIDCSIIYFLIKDNEVVYVGQSSLGICRPFQHTTKDFDSVSILKCKNEELDYLESRFILKYKPKYNHSILNSYSYSYKKIRELIRKETHFTQFTLNDLKYIVKTFEVPVETFEGVNYITREDFEKILFFLNSNGIDSCSSLRKFYT